MVVSLQLLPTIPVLTVVSTIPLLPVPIYGILLLLQYHPQLPVVIPLLPVVPTIPLLLVIPTISLLPRLQYLY